MKTMIILFSMFLTSTAPLSAARHTITASGFNFIPGSITVNAGDTINFAIGTSHNAVEVSLVTWNANDTTSNGGFAVPFGGGIFIPAEAGTYYYVCTPHASLGMKGMITVNSLTEVTPETEIFPDKFTLFQNYPNPFNPSTNLSFVIDRSSDVSVKIYDGLGQEVAALVNEFMQPGEYTVHWDAEFMASGFYTAVLRSNGLSQTRKILLLQ